MLHLVLPVAAATDSHPVGTWGIRSTVLGAVVLPALACYEPAIIGLIEPDDACAFSTTGATRNESVLDVGPTEALTHSYEAVLLLEARAGEFVTEASVAFSDVATGDPLPDTTYQGRTVVFPSVEGERESAVVATIGDDGLGAVPFTLVTAAEAAPLQALTDVGDDLELLVEIRAVVGGVGTTYPYFATLRICQQCLVGVGAVLDGDILVCPDGSDPSPAVDAPCREGQDEVFSSCD